MYIDTHCHLDRTKSLKKVVENARKARVGIMVSNGNDPKSNRKVLKMAEEFEEIKSALGFYPLDALEVKDSEIDKEIKFIKENKNSIVAIGEVGIDFKETREDDKQKKNFQKFVDLAKEIDKVIIVHSRKAEEQCLEILEKSKMKKVIMHCFSGKKKYIERIKDNGWYITIPSSVKYNEQFQLFVEMMPIEYILCETDSPFLHPDRQEENEPANVVESYKKISKIKKIKLKEVEERVEKNFKKLFNL